MRKNKHIKNTVILFIVGTIVFGIGNLFFGDYYFESANVFLTNFVLYQLHTFVLGYSNIAFFNYMEQLTWKKKDVVKRVILGVLGSVAVTLTALFILRLLIAISLDGKSFNTFIAEESIRNYEFGLWITLTFVVIFHGLYFYNKYQQNKIKEQQVIAGTASAKFDALKNQLDPHFLFNSLNVLTSLIEENPESAQRFTTALSKVYRYVLEQKNKALVTVDEELQFAKTYMSLLKMRFEESIIFTMPEKVSNPEYKVVPLALQLLLENAVKHNMVTPKAPLQIKIYEANDFLIVENNLQPRQMVKKSSGVGLSNIMQRYKLLTHKKIDINKEANRFAVAIPMLVKQTGIMKTQSQPEINDSYVRARNHVEELKRFYFGLVSYCLVIPFLIFVNYKTSWDFQWFWFPMFGWGLGLGIQAFRVFVNQGVFGRGWEKRKIEEFMREEEQNHWN